jgi:predicted negative regulator of RcsB-dependent stress response
MFSLGYPKGHLMIVVAILAIGVALAFAAFCGYLLWRLDAKTQRTRAIAAENKRLKQIARNKEAECVRLAEIVRESEAAYAQLQDSLKTGGWVQLLSDEQIEAGSWQ